MSAVLRMLFRMVAGVALALAVSVAPASAAVRPLAEPCLIPPGVYGIVDSSGNVVGLLIVYPDCRMEVYRPQEPI